MTDDPPTINLAAESNLPVSDTLRAARHDWFSRYLNMTEDALEEIETQLFVRFDSHNRLAGLLDEATNLRPELAMKLFKSVWTACDDTSGFWDEVEGFLWSARDEVDYRDFLSIEEHAWFDALPDRFRVYRGCDASQSAGLSWTTSRDVALSFAGGHRGITHAKPVVISGAVDKDWVLMATNGREEFEIMVGFEDVRDKRITSYRPGPKGLIKY
jgi:hypothetical protein